eukprot:gb/GECG01001292.1/.p1 GENE.gb/GECG01001292.1/~~gb/GECG01001292.1/.p1  ORF type:complete len:580 (+),score=63.15 gb/GECG01001292.1/:1-1740(+)
MGVSLSSASSMSGALKAGLRAGLASLREHWRAKPLLRLSTAVGGVGTCFAVVIHCHTLHDSYHDALRCCNETRECILEGNIIRARSRSDAALSKAERVYYEDHQRSAINPFNKIGEFLLINCFWGFRLNFWHQNMDKYLRCLLAQCHYHEGILRLNGKLNEAREHFQKANRLIPVKSAQPYYRAQEEEHTLQEESAGVKAMFRNMDETYDAAENVEEALSTFYMPVRNSMTFFKIIRQNHRAMALFAMGDYSSAIDDMTMVIETVDKFFDDDRLAVAEDDFRNTKWNWERDTDEMYKCFANILHTGAKTELSVQQGEAGDFDWAACDYGEFARQEGLERIQTVPLNMLYDPQRHDIEVLHQVRILLRKKMTSRINLLFFVNCKNTRRAASPQKVLNTLMEVEKQYWLTASVLKQCDPHWFNRENVHRTAAVVAHALYLLSECDGLPPKARTTARDIARQARGISDTGGFKRRAWNTYSRLTGAVFERQSKQLKCCAKMFSNEPRWKRARMELLRRHQRSSWWRSHEIQTLLNHDMETLQVDVTRKYTEAMEEEEDGELSEKLDKLHRMVQDLKGNKLDE